MDLSTELALWVHPGYRDPFPAELEHLRTSLDSRETLLS